MRLKNKIALITGSARGIGQAIAELFHREDAIVIVSDIREKEGKELAKKLGKKAEFIHLNVGSEDSWLQAVEHITLNYGRLDILVNNAGITGFLESPGPWDAENTDLKTWEEVHRINSTGVMLGCKYAIKLMKEQGGSIVNISSRSGIVGIPGAVAYASSKAAVRNHTKSVALYCAEKGYKIRCNSVHPAAIMTPMWDIMLGEGVQRQKLIEEIEFGIPMGYFGEPIDVAYGVLYLASDESKYVTGIELNIDGGILAGSDAKPRE
ncbi:SDR family oxidoreductase [Serpentinicella alkaliphila]|uniref:NAD(P)-dependent dehydrogenase (Short-subunit alcohol dehydrogenase family) n=1 Tax=Serpentinicella alkaliphila TaxID=1734049 RepID=A0A4V2T1D8_9FIRM|nr:SDR family oxidoreductase [Serpentinicella alkaliphila]TCP93243.1 NAD(P)-dependent dehydrogenase (short-subunit alcohol dehydrogenase family) [Serpentinicella alkaliphila]